MNGVDPDNGCPKNYTSSHMETVDISPEGLSLKCGFSFDIGGTMVKIVLATDEGDTVRLHFKSYHRDDLKEAIAFIKREMDGKLSKSPTVNVCGVGFQQHTDYIENVLGVKMKVLNEFECFTDAYRFLVPKLPEKDLYHDISKSTQEFIDKQVEGFSKMMGEFHEEEKSNKWEMGSETESSSAIKDDPAKSTREKTEAGSAPNEFPVMLCMLGSAGVGMKLETDGKYSIAEINTRCGQMFMGLGMMLTAAKSFDELTALAEAGDYTKLHVIGKHLKTGAEDAYSHVPDDMLCYSFGHCIGLDMASVSKEDMAAALLTSICQDLGQSMHQSAVSHNVRKMVFCGGFPGSSQVVRDEIAKHLGMRCVYNPQGIKYEYRFLKYGGYYGALGALLKTLTEG